MNKRWIFTHLLPIFLVVIVVAGITIAAVPQLRTKFVGYIKQFGPKAEEVEEKPDSQEPTDLCGLDTKPKLIDGTWYGYSYETHSFDSKMGSDDPNFNITERVKVGNDLIASKKIDSANCWTAVHTENYGIQQTMFHQNGTFWVALPIPRVVSHDKNDIQISKQGAWSGIRKIDGNYYVQWGVYDPTDSLAEQNWQEQHPEPPSYEATAETCLETDSLPPGNYSVAFKVTKPTYDYHRNRNWQLASSSGSYGKPYFTYYDTITPIIESKDKEGKDKEEIRRFDNPIQADQTMITIKTNPSSPNTKINIRLEGPGAFGPFTPGSGIDDPDNLGKEMLQATTDNNGEFKFALWAPLDIPDTTSQNNQSQDKTLAIFPKALAVMPSRVLPQPSSSTSPQQTTTPKDENIKITAWSAESCNQPKAEKTIATTTFEPIEGELIPNLICIDSQSVSENTKDNKYNLAKFVNTALAADVCAPIGTVENASSYLGPKDDPIIDISDFLAKILTEKTAEELKKWKNAIITSDEFGNSIPPKVRFVLRPGEGTTISDQDPVLIDVPLDTSELKNAVTPDEYAAFFAKVFNIDLLEKLKEKLTIKTLVVIGKNKVVARITPNIYKYKPDGTGGSTVTKIVLEFKGIISDQWGEELGTIVIGYGPDSKLVKYALPYGAHEDTELPELHDTWGYFLTISFKTGPGSPIDKGPLIEATEITWKNLVTQYRLVMEIYNKHKDDQNLDQILAQFISKMEIVLEINNDLPTAKLDGYKYSIDNSFNFKTEKLFPDNQYSYLASLFVSDQDKKIWGDTYFLENYASYYPDYESQYVVVEESPYFTLDNDMWQTLYADFGAENVRKGENKIAINMPSFLNYLKNNGDYSMFVKIDPKIPITENTVKQTAYIINENPESDNKISKKFAVLENDLWRKIKGQVTFKNGKPEDLGFAVGLLNQQNEKIGTYQSTLNFDQCSEENSQENKKWICSYAFEAPARIINNKATVLALYPKGLAQVIPWADGFLTNASINENGELIADINTDAFTAYESIQNSSDAIQNGLLSEAPIEAPISVPAAPAQPPTSKSFLDPIIEPLPVIGVVSDFLKLPGIIMNDEKKDVNIPTLIENQPENLLGFVIDKTVVAIDNTINTKTEETIDLPENKKDEIDQINQTADAASEEIKKELEIAVEKGPDNSQEVNDLLAKAFFNEVQRLDDIQKVITDKSLAEKIKEFSQNLSSDITNFITKNTVNALSYAFDKLSGFYTNNLGFISNNIQSYFSWIYQHILFS